MNKLAFWGLATTATAGFFYACGGDETSELTSTGSGATGNQGGAGASNQGGNGTGNEGGLSLSAGGTGGQGGGCIDLKLEGEAKVAPADIIFVIDNSGSMNDEINSVESNINNNFAQIIGMSQIDYRVIMLTNHGTGSYDVCIGPPLSGGATCSSAPSEVANQFYHYDYPVYSHDSLCVILNTLKGTNPDQHALHPGGWINLLRQEAIKVFVEITDDGIVCNWNSYNFNDSDASLQGQTVATDFDTALRNESPVHFGTAAARRYLFYSIVGMQEKASNPLDPYQEFEPVVTTNCTTPSVAYGPGTGYQWLSKGTKALRFPVCQWQSYDAVFQDIAAGVVEGAQLPCDVDLPSDVENLQYDTLVVEFTPSNGGPTEEWEKVTSEGACQGKDNAFWVDETTNTLHLCPAACTRVESDTGEPTLDIVAQCVDVAD